LKRGKIVEMGTYKELMDAGLDFASLITTHVDAEHPEETHPTKKQPVSSIQINKSNDVLPRFLLY
jgi:hypothetical protein